MTTPRRIPFPLLPKAELRRMLEMGIIEEVTGPTDWCAPMVPVERENRERVRVAAVLKTIRDSGLKCHFGKTEIRYFGHIIGADGSRPDGYIVKAI